MSIGRRSLGLVALAVLVSGCTKDMGVVSRFSGSAAQTAPATQSYADRPDLATAAPIIHALTLRPSAIQPGTPYAQVSEAVIASDSRVAEAELRVAQLRAEAAKYNWLPGIAPRVSLNSLGDFVADLLINQVLFDNGRKQAERDLAKAQVELAAVKLVEDSNRRVHDALTLFVRAEEARELAAHLDLAHADMTHFEWIMNERVKGGVSDMSDLNVLRQKLAAIRARRDEALETARTALAELHAMSASDLADLRGAGSLSPVQEGEPLEVLRAQAEREIALAEARIARASHLPGLTASGSVGDSGSLGGLNIGTDSFFSLGTVSDLRAIEAGKDAATRRVTEAAETSRRKIDSQASQFAAYTRQAQEAELLTRQAKQNLDIFQRQYDGGQRQVMDVVGVYETYAAGLETAISLKYKAARAELELARLRGALAEGARL
ncbi:TolC family protein [Maliponia aquimaris]|uniref:Outer membrane efflux protein n=1 Tax=Maliponia aquimaris TaxID=1673631 RepID=A0A238K9G3_9RHOB|nr:TolC family protein [Maliponia aquimaris]SMX39054.1 Outer membrane efflux protein [Maliponia aquimaris]